MTTPLEPTALLPISCEVCREPITLVVRSMPWEMAERKTWRCPYPTCDAENSQVMADHILEALPGHGDDTETEDLPVF